MRIVFLAMLEHLYINKRMLNKLFTFFNNKADKK